MSRYTAKDVQTAMDNVNRIAAKLAEMGLLPLESGYIHKGGGTPYRMYRVENPGSIPTFAPAQGMLGMTAREAVNSLNTTYYALSAIRTFNVKVDAN